jgi:hypothetical protein
VRTWIEEEPSVIDPDNPHRYTSRAARAEPKAAKDYAAVLRKGKMDELTLLAGREENFSPAGIMAAAVTAALATCVLFFAPAAFAQPASDSLGELLVGKAAFGDWRTDAPLVRRKITDLPPPYATRSASNPPRVIAKPASATPKVPPGFEVELFVSNLNDPRVVRIAPNGDIFIAESEPGRIRVLRAADGAAKPSSNDVFASGLDHPFGIAFYPPGSDPQWIYVATTGSVVRYPYRSGDLKARGKAEVIVRDLSRATPVPTGSPAVAKMIGMADVACFEAKAAGIPDVTMTSTLSRTNSAATSAKRSSRPSAQRYSIAMVRPSFHPSSCTAIGRPERITVHERLRPARRRP